MGRQDLKKFLKRVSTPLGTKSKASAVISSHDFNRIITKKEVRFLLFSNFAQPTKIHTTSKTKLKSKKSPIIMKHKRPMTQPAS